MAQSALLAVGQPSTNAAEATINLRKTPPRPKPLVSSAGPRDSLEAAARDFQAILHNHAAPVTNALESWCTGFVGPREHAQLFRDLHRSDPEAADRLAEAMTTMPAVGVNFLGFELRAELGRGAFGRVYLAQQGDLANRLVVVKVAANVWGEVQALAQLQHPNIVPVYSVHQSGPLQAVCMPFQGCTTLQDVLLDVRNLSALPHSGKTLVEAFRNPTVELDGLSTETPKPHALAKLSYVEAVVWLGSRLADGLAHAHAHGIIHNDLKPANVLLSDDGQPMLLDFNVAEDVKTRSKVTAAWIAGTLLYMAPEQLAGLLGDPVSADGRCDLYAFGILLFELLTGQYPFSTHDSQVPLVDRILDDCRKLLPAYET